MSLDSYLASNNVNKESDNEYRYKDFTLSIDRYGEVISIRIDSYNGNVQDIDELEGLVRVLMDYTEIIDGSDSDEDNKTIGVRFIVIEGLQGKPQWDSYNIYRLHGEPKPYVERKSTTIITKHKQYTPDYIIKDAIITCKDGVKLYNKSKHELLINFIKDKNRVSIKFNPPFIYKRVDVLGIMSLITQGTYGGHKLEIPKFEYHNTTGYQSIYTENKDIYMFIPGIDIDISKKNNVKYDVGVYLRIYINHAANIIKRYWRNAIANPSHKLCRERLIREYNSIISKVM